MLRSRQGILRAEVLPKRDGDAYTYNIESEVGVDIRKNLFYALAERNWPLVGMETLGMNLEDIFIAIVDQSATARYEKKGAMGIGGAEGEVAKDLLAKASDKQGGEFSALFGNETNEGK